MKNPSLYKSGVGGHRLVQTSSSTTGDGRSQVQLSKPESVSTTLNLNGATTKGECETPSSVTGAAVLVEWKRFQNGFPLLTKALEHVYNFLSIRFGHLRNESYPAVHFEETL